MGEALCAPLFEHIVEEADAEDEIDDVEREAHPKIVDGEWLMVEDLPHPFEDVGRREGPGDRLRPGR